MNGYSTARSAAQRAASAENAKMAGRPKHNASQRVLAIKRRARWLGEIELVQVVEFFKAVYKGLVPDATVADRLRAAENICDRFGLPRLQQQQMVGEIATQIIDLRRWDQLEAANQDALPAVEVEAPPENPEEPN